MRVYFAAIGALASVNPKKTTRIMPLLRNRLLSYHYMTNKMLEVYVEPKKKKENNGNV